MEHLLYILLNISLPIIILISIGFGFQKVFKTDAKTLPKLMLYLLVPVAIFVQMYKADITPAFFGQVALFTFMMIAAMLLISLVLSRLMHFSRSRRNAQHNAMTLFNTGNYGIPLIALVFSGNPLTTASQLFIVIIQNITGNTLGVYMASSGKGTSRRALLSILKMPSLYAIALAVLFKVFPVTVPPTIMIPLGYLEKSFVAVALLTLGVQLATVKFSGSMRDVLISSFVKIITAPLLGFAFVLALGIEGMLAQALIIGISTPTAVFSAIIAREFDNEVDYASQMVLSTTLLCTLTLPLVIWVVQSYF